MKPVLILFLIMFATSASASRQFDPFQVARIDERPGAAIPMTGTFQDSSGKQVSLGAIADGRPLLLVPVLHQCPNFCGVTLAGVMKAIAGQSKRPGRDFSVVAFGIDPEEGIEAAREDLDSLKKATNRQTLDDVHALTGTKAEITRITSALGYHYAFDPRIGQYAHAAAIAVLTPDGHLSRWFYGLSPDPNELSQAIATAAQNKGGGWAKQLLLVCFHYDPESGKYTPAITKMLRLAGLATLMVLAVAILRMRRKNA